MKIDFRRPEISDAFWVHEAFEGTDRMCSESCFGNLFMWCESYDCTIANIDGILVCKVKDSYTFPIGGDDDTVFSLLEKFNPPIMHAICPGQKDKIEARLPGVYEFTENRDVFDYIYSVSDLANLPGKKYRSKRNHISFFDRTYSWKYKKMDASTGLDCIEFSKQWVAENSEKNVLDEFYALSKALTNFDALGLVGGIIYVDGEIVAYTFGEPISKDLFCTHVEKAIASMRGAYQLINREFARNSINDFSLVNREEDLGIPGLRKAKESYHPQILLPKYIARRKT